MEDLVQTFAESLSHQVCRQHDGRENQESAKELFEFCEIFSFLSNNSMSQLNKDYNPTFFELLEYQQKVSFMENNPDKLSFAAREVCILWPREMQEVHGS